MTPLISTREAARSSGISARTATRLCARGLWPAVRVGRLWKVDAAALAVLTGAAEPDLLDAVDADPRGDAIHSITAPCDSGPADAPQAARRVGFAPSGPDPASDAQDAPRGDVEAA